MYGTVMAQDCVTVFVVLRDLCVMKFGERSTSARVGVGVRVKSVRSVNVKNREGCGIVDVMKRFSPARIPFRCGFRELRRCSEAT